METKILTNGTNSTTADPLNTAETTTMKKNFEEKEIVIADASEAIPEKPEHNPDHEIADEILKSAKEDGFEDALQKLADGEFEKDLKESEVVKAEENLLEELIVDEEIFIQEPITPENGYMVERIHELEARVANLELKNKELSERLRNSENLNIMTIFSLAEIARILAEMIKEEEKGEEKVSLLEILVEVLQEIFHAIIDPNGEMQDNEKEEHSSNEEEENNPRRTLLEIVEKLQAEGQIRTNRQIQQDVHSAQAA